MAETRMSLEPVPLAVHDPVASLATGSLTYDRPVSGPFFPGKRFRSAIMGGFLQRRAASGRLKPFRGTEGAGRPRPPLPGGHSSAAQYGASE
jgi:hypothetical protein